jgi:murein DD-endopeptidase MepM/ murein hydrolase activator NlpD
MIEYSISDVRERILKAFPERQFIHRTGGKVNYFVLTTKAQLIMASIALVIAIWCLFTLLTITFGGLGSSKKEFRVQKAQYERYLVDLQDQEQDARQLLVEQQKQFELAAKSFEAKHNTILSMMNAGGFSNDQQDDGFTTYAQSKIMMSPVVVDPLARFDRIAISQSEKLQTGTTLDASLASLELDQNKILYAGESNILARIEKDRAILKSTGISIDAILQYRTDGMGGPLISLTDETPKTNDGKFLPRLETIKARINEAEMLETTLKAVPLGHPIDAEHYLTSSYGQRRDPFTKRPTMHTGMDMASYKMAPIVATANGKISFVGRRKGYGRVVEIDHGYGFKTRYAHLNKSFVKRGQMVEKGEKIAGMGSSGRSTSTHLHYEIYFQNKSYNPNSFLKAGQYVQ